MCFAKPVCLLRTSQEAALDLGLISGVSKVEDEATASTDVVEVTSSKVTWAGEDNEDSAVCCCVDGGDARKEAADGGVAIVASLSLLLRKSRFSELWEASSMVFCFELTVNDRVVVLLC